MGSSRVTGVVYILLGALTPNSAKPLRSTCAVALSKATRARLSSTSSTRKRLRRVVAVEGTGQVTQVEGDVVRGETLGGGREHAGNSARRGHQRQLGIGRQQGQVGASQGVHIAALLRVLGARTDWMRAWAY